MINRTTYSLGVRPLALRGPLLKSSVDSSAVDRSCDVVPHVGSDSVDEELIGGDSSYSACNPLDAAALKDLVQQLSRLSDLVHQWSAASAETVHDKEQPIGRVTVDSACTLARLTNRADELGQRCFAVSLNVSSDRQPASSSVLQVRQDACRLCEQLSRLAANLRPLMQSSQWEVQREFLQSLARRDDLASSTGTHGCKSRLDSLLTEHHVKLEEQLEQLVENLTDICLIARSPELPSRAS